MRDILVFGDSNTWGADPADDKSCALLGVALALRARELPA